MSSKISKYKVIKEEKENFIQLNLQKIQKNDKPIIKKVLEKFSDEIYSFPIRYYNFSRDEAGDFYVTVYEHFYRHNKLAKFQGRSSFYTWLFAVLRNLAIDFIRIKKTNIDSILQSEPVEVKIEDVDTRDESLNSVKHLIISLKKQLLSLKIHKRVLFKLVYIFFFKLTVEELEWLFETSPVSKEEIFNEIIILKEKSADKILQVRLIEDKLTQLHQKILLLENIVYNFFVDFPDLPNKPDNWFEEYENLELPENITFQIQLLSKKKKIHLNLLEQHRKKLLATKAPLKEVARLLGVSENYVSIELARIKEVFNNSFN